MPNPWFRMYSEFADDPKVQMMPEVMQRRLVMLFCERCKCETLHETERAFHWRINETELAQTKAVFVEKGFIDEQWNLLNWNRRQFISDSSTERVRQYRERMKQGETLQKHDGPVSVTPPDTDTDTDTDQNKKQKRAVVSLPPLAALEQAGLSLEDYESYMAVRKAKKQPFVDERARDKWLAKWKGYFDSGLDTAAMFDLMISSGWIGPVDDKWTKRKREYVETFAWNDIGATPA
jgi:hypothetical protein